MKMYDVIIIGAGASGLMCAAHLRKDIKIAVMDGNEKVAKKLKVSGGGKCNITNIDVSASHYDGDFAFVQRVLDAFSKDDLLKYLKKNGLVPVIRDERYYFCKESSQEIISLLLKGAEGVDFLLSHAVEKVIKQDGIFYVKSSRGEYGAKKVIVATGAKSYDGLGASDIGLEIAKNFGLKTEPFEPALVGLTLQKEQFWMKELSGISCNVCIKVENKSICESLLFAHRGISGLAVLSASLYWRRGKIAIDFLPSENVLRLVSGSKKLLSSVLPLPKRLCVGLLAACEIEDIACNKLTSHAKEKLCRLHHYEFAPAGNFGFSRAEVSRGGVDTGALESSFEIKSIENLYFIGEVLNVTGELGGYNFQWAFSSAVVCARAINSLKF